MSSDNYKNETPYAMPLYDQNQQQYQNPFSISNYVAYPSLSNYQYNNYDNNNLSHQQPIQTNQPQQYENSYNQALNEYADQQYYNLQINKQIKYKNKMQSQLKWNTNKKSTPYSKSSTNNNMLYCELCKVSCAGEQSYKEHCDGQKHKKKENLAKNLSQSNSSFFCDVCQVSCSCLDAFNAHLIGKNHIKVCNLQIKLGKEVPNELIAPIMKPDNSNISNNSNNNDSCPSFDSLLNNTKTNSNNLKKNSVSITENIIKVIGTPAIKFVKGSSLTTTSQEEDEMKLSTQNDNAQIKSNSEIDNSSSTNNVPSTSSIVNTQIPKATITDSIIENDNKTFKSTQPNADEKIPLLNESMTSLKDINNSSIISNVEPIGMEYIYEYKIPNSKAIYFHCKLCDCKFSEIIAKEQHIRGKRHHKNFNNEKKKSNAKMNNLTDTPIINHDQDLNNIKQKKNKKARVHSISSDAIINQTQSNEPITNDQVEERNPFLSNINITYLDEIQFSIDDFQSLDEKYLFKKHSEIVPREKDLKFYYEKISLVERSLKQVSDEILNNSKVFNEIIKLNANYNERLLVGELRAGLFGKKLLLDGENQIDLILICSVKPNIHLLKKLTELLSIKLELLDKSLKIEENIPLASIDVHADKTIIRITLTSLAFRDINLPLDDNLVPPEPEEILDKDKCLDALTALRRFKWYQTKIAPFSPCPMLIRILRDLTKRIDAWKPLTSWSLELMTERIFSNCLNRPTISEAFKYFLQTLASGIILTNPQNINNIILPDPCEIGCVDALAYLNDKQREEITESAKKLVQFISFNKIYEVLDTEIIKLDDDNKINTENNSENNIEPIELDDKCDDNKMNDENNQSVIEITNDTSIIS